MRTLYFFFLLSTQLVLHTEKALSLPIINPVINNINAFTAFPPIPKHKNDEQMQRRAITQESKPISKMTYNAKATGIAAKQVTQKLFHGPFRAAADVPASGLFGSGKQFIKGCKYLGKCRIGKASENFLGAGTKALLSTTVLPVGVAIYGAATAVPPTAKMIKHAGMTVVHGAGYGVKKAIILPIDEKRRRSDRLDRQKRRSSDAKDFSGSVTKWLREDKFGVNNY